MGYHLTIYITRSFYTYKNVTIVTPIALESAKKENEEQGLTELLRAKETYEEVGGWGERTKKKTGENTRLSRYAEALKRR